MMRMSGFPPKTFLFKFSLFSVSFVSFILKMAHDQNSFYSVPFVPFLIEYSHTHKPLERPQKPSGTP